MMTKKMGIWMAAILCALQAQAATIYVDKANSGAEDGTSWATADS